MEDLSKKGKKIAIIHKKKIINLKDVSYLPSLLEHVCETGRDSVELMSLKQSSKFLKPSDDTLKDPATKKRKPARYS